MSADGFAASRKPGAPGRRPTHAHAESRTFRFLTMWRAPRSSELPSTVRKDPVACFQRQHFG
jgi:hypothetical protein